MAPVTIALLTMAPRTAAHLIVAQLATAHLNMVHLTTGPSLQVVLSAFMRDRLVLVELFQRVGRTELEFLVQSGIYFGFLLGLLQMVGWMRMPSPWTLPVAGAAVGCARWHYCYLLCLWHYLL
jgi:hypothetical protein